MGDDCGSPRARRSWRTCRLRQRFGFRDPCAPAQLALAPHALAFGVGLFLALFLVVVRGLRLLDELGNVRSERGQGLAELRLLLLLSLERLRLAPRSREWTLILGGRLHVSLRSAVTLCTLFPSHAAASATTAAAAATTPICVISR